MYLIEQRSAVDEVWVAPEGEGARRARRGLWAVYGQGAISVGLQAVGPPAATCHSDSCY